MIDIIFLAVIAGVLIIRLLMVLGEKRDDDPSPPFSLLDINKTAQSDQRGDQRAGQRDSADQKSATTGGRVDNLPEAEVVEPEPVGFFATPPAKHSAKSSPKLPVGMATKDNPDKVATTAEAPSPAGTIEDSRDPRWAAAWAGIMAIKARDSYFSADAFLNGAEKAFEAVLNGFVHGSEPLNKNPKASKGGPGNGLDLLREYIAPALLPHFVTAIKDREKKSYRMEHRNLIGVRLAHIIKAGVDEQQRLCRITVLFESDQIYALYDKDNKLVEGDETVIIPKKDLWVFEKKLAGGDSGRWWLVAVEE